MAAAHGKPTGPPIVVVMGVAGSGKTTVSALLANELGWRYAEADDFLPRSSVEKMAAGHPLTDEDRRPWLEAIGRWIDERRAAHEPGVVSCSALKRAYRDVLRRGRPEVRAVYLDGSRELIASRLSSRYGHFFPPSMLDSQFADLEPPVPGEHVLSVPIDGTPRDVVDRIINGLRLRADPANRAPAG